MKDGFEGILVGTAGLSALLVVAVTLTLARPRISTCAGTHRRLTRIALIAIAAASVHFAEELVTGFHEQFPRALGLQPWPLRFFVPFNLTWIAIWLGALVAVRFQHVSGLVPLWFLGLAALGNLVAHPLLAFRATAYFPGLFTAPLLGAVGLLLLRELAAITSPD